MQIAAQIFNKNCSFPSGCVRREKIKYVVYIWNFCHCSYICKFSASCDGKSASGLDGSSTCTDSIHGLRYVYRGLWLG